MNLYAICLVKNEDDVIEQTLVYAARFCEKIFVIDNGSTDATWEVVKSVARRYPQVDAFMQTNERYDDALRWHAYEAYQHKLSADDWWLVLDGDEFLAEDPRGVIEAAVRESADVVLAWQIQFYYTDRDHDEWLSGRDNREREIWARRRYYRIDCQEPRLFRHQPNTDWRTAPLSRKLPMPPWIGKGPSGGPPTRCGRIARRRIFNRHYQYRDPIQIEKRLKLRYGHPAFGAQVSSLDWRSVLRPARSLDLFQEGEPWRFRLRGLAHLYSGRVRYAVVSRARRTRDRLMGLVGV